MTASGSAWLRIEAEPPLGDRSDEHREVVPSDEGQSLDRYCSIGSRVLYWRAWWAQSRRSAFSQLCS